MKNIDEIKNYFNEDIKTRVREMSDTEMKNAFKMLEGTEAWFAILKYIQDRTEIIKDTLLTLDPMKDQSKISQYQGIASGLWDLPDAVLDIKFVAKKSENPRKKEEEAIDELGGAYAAY